MMTLITWLVRYGHVLSAALWFSGYAFLALILVPAMEQGAGETLHDLAVVVVRVGTYAGTITIGFGIVLITRTRGFGRLVGGEWGGLVLACITMAIALLGIGDGALRPALKRLAAGRGGRDARRWTYIGLALTVAAIGMMTRAIYART